jgi:hypothetical protein
MNTLDLKLGDKFSAKGLHIFSLCKADHPVAQAIEGFIENVRIRREEFLLLDTLTEKVSKDLSTEYQYWIKKLHERFLVKQFVVENITTTVGRAVLAKRLAGINTYSGNVSHTALGSSATAPSVADVQLGTEVYRKALSSGTSSNNISYLETFFTAAEVNGTFEEYGNFIDGSGSANSGQLFNRFTQTVAKSNVETLNVQSIITLNDA